jgi:hypothetical protein
MQDEELIERIDRMLLASPLEDDGTMIAVEPDDLREIRDRLEALAQPVVGVPSAFDLMQEFYLSKYYEPKAARPADNVQAAIEFTLDRLAALEASPSPVVGDEGRREISAAIAYAAETIRLIFIGHPTIRRRPLGSRMNTAKHMLAKADAILSSTPVMSVSGEAAKAYRNCAEMNRQMAGTIGAAPGSSIFAALEACAERMDEIALSTPVAEAARGREG